jgi:VanZ family protein
MLPLAITYLTGVFILSILPVNGPGSGMNDIYVVQLRLDYLLHALLFLPVPAFVRGLRFKVQCLKGKGWGLVFAGVFSLLFAVLCELVQWPLPYRAFNINDLLANLTGALIGMVIFLRQQ